MLRCWLRERRVEDGEPAVSVSTLTLRRTNFAIKYFSYYMPRYHRHVELHQSMTPTGGVTYYLYCGHDSTSIENVSRGALAGILPYRSPPKVEHSPGLTRLLEDQDQELL